MTFFDDGPAKGQTLMLKRAPINLRVVEKDGKWDALDQPTDKPNIGEKIYAYRIKGEVGHCHINRGGGRGGFYVVATYSLAQVQPSDEVMRNNNSWVKWCESKR